MQLQIPSSVNYWIKSTKTWKNNYLFLREFKHFPRVAILALIFSILAATFEGFSIGFLLSFLQSLTSPNAQPIQTGISWFDIWVLGVNTSVTSRLYRISILIVLTTWIRAGFNYLSLLYIDITQLNFLDRLRKQIFEQLQAVNLSFFTKTKSGELINSITTEIEKLRQAFGGVAFLIGRGLTVFTYLLSMFLLSWQLTIISFLLFGLLAAGLSNLIAKTREKSFPVTVANGQLTSTAIEFINGIRTIQAFATQNFERQRYYQASSELIRTATELSRSWIGIKPFSEGLATTLLVTLIIISFTGILQGITINVASLLTFFFILFRLVPIVQDVNGTRAFLATMQGATDNIKNLLREDNKNYFQNGHIEFPGLKRSIDFRLVDFGYDATSLVLKNISLKIEKGQMTALVGASGAGKTTLADLIVRFYDPIKGAVLIDGVDLRHLDINSLRRKLATVSQDTFIFNTTIRNNIAYGINDIADREIMEAAKSANALDFIQEMPQGFETILGDRGVRLSGGQRQRIAIARALLRNPEILILDEATSALDSVSERLIQDSIEQLTVGRTVIAIAHRLSTIMRADKVIVLEQGEIVEQGTYNELLALRGKLWKYHQMQHESS
ncbi:MAG: heterocyst formation ABC transporter subunit HepA [Chroococcidiopsis sp.]